MTKMRKTRDRSDILLKGLFEDMIRDGKSIKFQVRGSSMRPFIEDGEFLVVRPIQPQEANIGDVIAYQDLQRKKITIHRLIKKKLNSYSLSLILAGDNNMSEDLPACPVNHLFAKVVAIERNGGTINVQSGWNRAYGYLVVCLLRFCPKGLKIILKRFARSFYHLRGI